MIINRDALMTLKYKCIRAVLLPFLFAPRDERIAVIHVPTSAPMTTGIAMLYLTLTERDKACRTPIVPAELWMIIVKRIPTRNPIIGLLKVVRIALNESTSLRGETALDIELIPNIRTEKPRRMVPTFFFFSVLPNI